MSSALRCWPGCLAFINRTNRWQCGCGSSGDIPGIIGRVVTCSYLLGDAIWQLAEPVHFTVRCGCGAIATDFAVRAADEALTPINLPPESDVAEHDRQRELSEEW